MLQLVLKRWAIFAALLLLAGAIGAWVYLVRPSPATALVISRDDEAPSNPAMSLESADVEANCPVLAEALNDALSRGRASLGGADARTAMAYLDTEFGSRQWSNGDHVRWKNASVILTIQNS